MSCCFTIVATNEQIIITNCQDKRIVRGDEHPGLTCICPWWEVQRIPAFDLRLNQYATIHNEADPSTNTVLNGPMRVFLRDAWDEVVDVEDSPILDQNDYMVITNTTGAKRNFMGPGVFQPVYGETFTDIKNSVQVPVNYYMVVEDANDPTNPVSHIRGPLKFYPEPFQTLIEDRNTGKPYFRCIEVSNEKGVHLQKASGDVVLLDEPQFYMPQIGEQVVRIVPRVILVQTDFCILKHPDGQIIVRSGVNEADRSFFPEPFAEFMEFQCEKKEQTILSTLPTFMSHTFAIRTCDNVVMTLDIRVSYQIQNIGVFAANPIDFYGYIKNFIQNELLERFSKVTLRVFMSSFSTTAMQSAENCSEKQFRKFGIEILDVQILNYVCAEKETQRLLDMDIHTNVTKQNELRITQNDILIQEELNKVHMREKDLEVELTKKDNEILMKRKILENEIRIKEMEIGIAEERKRTELLELRRGNDLMEAEFEGRARGHEFREFLLGIDQNLSPQQKVDLWVNKVEFEKAQMVYNKVSSINMYPPNADLKLFNFGGDGSGSAGMPGSPGDDMKAKMSSAISDGAMRYLGAESLASKMNRGKEAKTLEAKPATN